MCANGSTSTVRDSEPVTAKAPPREEPSLWGALFSGGNVNYIISFGFRQGYYSTLPLGYARGNFIAGVSIGRFLCGGRALSRPASRKTGDSTKSAPRRAPISSGGPLLCGGFMERLSVLAFAKPIITHFLSIGKKQVHRRSRTSERPTR